MIIIYMARNAKHNIDFKLYLAYERNYSRYTFVPAITCISCYLQCNIKYKYLPLKIVLSSFEFSVNMTIFIFCFNFSSLSHYAYEI